MTSDSKFTILVILAILIILALLSISYTQYNLAVSIRDSIPNNNIEAGKQKVIKINGTDFVFCWCPAGTFTMGSDEDQALKETSHIVTLTKGFWMMETEVTQKQWKAVMGYYTNPSHFQGDDLPVESISWEDCQVFCNQCKKLGISVSLPTEAQWEYACRAGSTEKYIDYLDKIAWYYKNSGGTTHPVRTKSPNAWGLYDMLGNVLEWCSDWYGDYPEGMLFVSARVTDPMGPVSGPYHVFRGGCWNDLARDCRYSCRFNAVSESLLSCYGLRLVLKPESNQNE